MAGMFAVVEATGGVHSAHAYRMSTLVGTAVAATGLAAAYALRRIEQRGGMTTRAAEPSARMW